MCEPLVKYQAPATPALATFPRWSLLAGEVEETEKDVVVRVELPGLDKEDCQITIEGNLLLLSDENHLERETHDSTYHVMERGYGTTQRTLPAGRDAPLLSQTVRTRCALV